MLKEHAVGPAKDPLLGDLFEEELPAPQKHRFESHLTNCPECVSYLAAYRTTIRLARTSSRPSLPAMPEDLVQAILASAASGRDRPAGPTLTA